ncbi:hypothetical protein [Nocardioides speluncae]|uniref:hypothetical protein n=1 Tax=Nocardioides speluncae TaxID=2670337 RepID=UPI000D6930A3|nr:hypothetical protein [Nocardioides speluncae]
MPVRPETTEADLQAFFEAMNAGKRPPVMPFTGAPPSGMPVLEAGGRALVRPALAPGRYTLVSWVVDLDDGTMLAARGMHTLVTVR